MIKMKIPTCENLSKNKTGDILKLTTSGTSTLAFGRKSQCFPNGHLTNMQASLANVLQHDAALM